MSTCLPQKGSSYNMTQTMQWEESSIIAAQSHVNQIMEDSAQNLQRCYKQLKLG